MGIAPSEVRAMTPHEILAVIAIKTKDSGGMSNGDLEELYRDYIEARDGA